MSFPDILVVIVAGSRDIRRNMIDVGRSFGAGRLHLATKVMLPAMLPFITTALRVGVARSVNRSEEHTSELQSLMRISYAVFCLKKKKKRYNLSNTITNHTITHITTQIKRK